jgi:hypothetical protein
MGTASAALKRRPPTTGDVRRNPGARATGVRGVRAVVLRRPREKGSRAGRLCTYVSLAAGAPAPVQWLEAAPYVGAPHCGLGRVTAGRDPVQGRARPHRHERALRFVPIAEASLPGGCRARPDAARLPVGAAKLPHTATGDRGAVAIRAGLAPPQAHLAPGALRLARPPRRENSREFTHHKVGPGRRCRTSA